MPYADQAVALRTPIVEHLLVARDTWRLRLKSPDIARQMLPGQFVMLRIAGCNDPLIGRALAIYDRYGQQDDYVGIDLVYLVKGKFTQSLSRYRPGQEVEIWGPLGNAFSTSAVDRLILVAGGVGQTPMLVASKEALGHERFGIDRPFGYADQVTFCYGARAAELLAGVESFEGLGVEVQISTDDGSVGSPRLVTVGLIEILDRSAQRGESVRIICCGPEPMMHAVATIAQDRCIPCALSLETPMACGIGICFTCVARIKQSDGSWDYKRTCVEGPIFDAETIDW